MKEPKPRIEPVVIWAGVLAGFAVWFGLTAAAGGKEPWDRNLGLYAAGLFAGGFVVGWFSPSVWKQGVFGIYGGQILAILLVSRGQLGLFIPMGLCALAVFTLISALGALLGSGIRLFRGRADG